LGRNPDVQWLEKELYGFHEDREPRFVRRDEKDHPPYRRLVGKFPVQFPDGEQRTYNLPVYFGLPASVAENLLTSATPGAVLRVWIPVPANAPKAMKDVLGVGTPMPVYFTASDLKRLLTELKLRVAKFVQACQKSI
jgi:hypothetical protein